MALAYQIPSPVPTACSVAQPATLRGPVVFASPHSGRYYPPDFISLSKLDTLDLRRSEDCFVDELFAAVPDLGAPLLQQHYARAYCDVNREPYELDPAMFHGPLPTHANHRSPRVAAGLGTIARVVSSGVEIYRDRLPVSEIEARLDRVYRPYHHLLDELVKSVQARWGWALVVDCHSMPNSDRGQRPGIVLGDCHGESCSPEITRLIQTSFEALGYDVALNTPYAGGYTTRHYGVPSKATHAIQIEIGRGLYLSGSGLEKSPAFDKVSADLTVVCSALMTEIAGGGFTP